MKLDLSSTPNILAVPIAISEYPLKSQYIWNEKPNIIAISSLTSRIYEAYKLSATFRKNGITVVIGGLHVSVLPDEAKEHADVIVQGEGEICWEALLRDYENNSLIFGKFFLPYSL